MQSLLIFLFGQVVFLIFLMLRFIACFYFATRTKVESNDVASSCGVHTINVKNDCLFLAMAETFLRSLARPLRNMFVSWNIFGWNTTSGSKWRKIENENKNLNFRRLVLVRVCRLQFTFFAQAISLSIRYSIFMKLIHLIDERTAASRWTLSAHIPPKNRSFDRMSSETIFRWSTSQSCLFPTSLPPFDRAKQNHVDFGKRPNDEHKDSDRCRHTVCIP